MADELAQPHCFRILISTPEAGGFHRATGPDVKGQKVLGNASKTVKKRSIRLFCKMRGVIKCNCQTLSHNLKILFQPPDMSPAVG